MGLSDERASRSAGRRTCTALAVASSCRAAWLPAGLILLSRQEVVGQQIAKVPADRFSGRRLARGPGVLDRGVSPGLARTGLRRGAEHPYRVPLLGGPPRPAPRAEARMSCTFMATSSAASSTLGRDASAPGSADPRGLRRRLPGRDQAARRRIDCPRAIPSSPTGQDGGGPRAQVQIASDHGNQRVCGSRRTDVAGPDLVDSYRRSATHVAKILKGANPAELQMEQPTKFDLFVNLETARGCSASPFRNRSCCRRAK